MMNSIVVQSTAWSCHVEFDGGSVPIVILALTLQVDGDDTVALQSVLECDEERERLLAKERELTNKRQEL